MSEKIILTSADELTTIIRNAVRAELSSSSMADKANSSPDDFVTADEAVIILKLKSKEPLYQAIHHKKLSSHKRFGKLYFRRGDLVQWLQDGRRPNREERIREINNESSGRKVK